MNKILLAKIIGTIYLLILFIPALDTKFFSIDFLMHLIPLTIALLCLITSFFKQKIGGISFIIFGIITIFFFNTYKEILTFLIITIPPILSGYLFLPIKKTKRK